MPTSYFEPSIAGLAYRLPVDPKAVIAQIATLASHRPDWGMDVFHGYGYQRPFLVGAIRKTSDGTIVPDSRFQGFDVNWYFLTEPGTPVVAPVAGRVMKVDQIMPGEPDMSIMINQTGEYDWIWEIDHVVNVRVEAGDWIEVGEQIAEVSPEVAWTQEPSFASSPGFSFALLEDGGGDVGMLHYCPLIGLDPAGLVLEQLEQIHQALGAHYQIDSDDHPRWATCATDQPIGGHRFSGGMGVVPDYAHMRDAP